MSATTGPSVAVPNDGFSVHQSVERESAGETGPPAVPLCPSQFPHEVIWVRTRVVSVGGRNPSDCAVAKLTR
jgi:hypothetical protein